MSIIFKPHRRATPAPAPPAPPFALNSADNGLSVDPVTFEIVLGQDIGAAGDPARLLSTREIPFAGNDLNFNRAIDAGLGIPAQQGNMFVNLLFGPPGGSYAFTVKGARNDGVTDALEFTVTKHGLQCTDDVNGTPINVLTADNISLLSDNGISLIPPVYRMGDVNNVLNGQILSIDDSIQDIFLGDPTFINPVMEMRGILAGSPLIDLFVPDVLGNYADLSVAHNGSPFIQQEVQGVSDRYDIRLFADDVTGDGYFIRKTNAPASNFFFIDFLNSLFQLGDIDALLNGTFLEIDDTNNVFRFGNTANNAGININGVAGFTGTVTPVTSITVDAGIVTNVT